MVTLGMQGSYTLTEEKIDEVVTKISPGNYALGHVMEDKFYVEYVGRADTNLNTRLKDWIKKYSRFKFSYASSLKAAFEKECKNYHDFGENNILNNLNHPDRPSESNWKCPHCDIFK